MWIDFAEFRSNEFVIAPTSEPLSQGTFRAGDLPCPPCGCGVRASADFVEDHRFVEVHRFVEDHRFVEVHRDGRRGRFGIGLRQDCLHSIDGSLGTDRSGWIYHSFG
jgi:hypothetical protein